MLNWVQVWLKVVSIQTRCREKKMELNERFVSNSFDPFSLVSSLQNDTTDHFISRTTSFILLLFPSDKRCDSEWMIYELIKQNTIETNKVTHTTWWEQQWGWISFVSLLRRKLQEEKTMKCKRWRRRTRWRLQDGGEGECYMEEQ